MNKKLISVVVLAAAIGIMPFLAGAQSVPMVTSISPTSVVAGSANTSLLVYGTNFMPGAIVEFNGLPLATAYL